MNWTANNSRSVIFDSINLQKCANWGSWWSSNGVERNVEGQSSFDWERVREREMKNVCKIHKWWIGSCCSTVGRGREWLSAVRAKIGRRFGINSRQHSTALFIFIFTLNVFFFSASSLDTSRCWWMWIQTSFTAQFHVFYCSSKLKVEIYIIVRRELLAQESDGSGRGKKTFSSSHEF